jgi:hypothetical protein
MKRQTTARVRRRLVDLLAGLSLLACLAAAALGVRSHFRMDDFGCRDGRQGYYQLSSDRGQVLFAHVAEWRGETTMLLGFRTTPITQRERDHRTGPPIGHHWHGFQFFHLPDRPGYTIGDFRGVAAPHWFLAAFFVTPPLFRFGPRLRDMLRGRRRAARGLCPSCGYDLTGNTSGVCPECGQTASPPTRRQTI